MFTKRRVLIGIGVGVLLLMVITAIYNMTPSGKEAARVAEEERQAIAATKTAGEVEKRRSGLHCLSEWDGNHDGLELLVKRDLKDPDSMKTAATVIGQVTQKGYHTIIMDFRSRNSFGGMVMGQAKGLVDSETCEATLVSIE